MALLSWKPEFSVGIESVDYEHQELIRMINEIYDEMTSHKDADSIEQFVGDVHYAISAHFALEERLMREARYHEYEAHKEDHEDLLDQLRNLMDQLVSNPDEGIKVLKESLSDWFERHFATFDARLHGQLENRG
jgi:hemerythrin